jgi:hypothetical protein
MTRPQALFQGSETSPTRQPAGTATTAGRVSMTAVSHLPFQVFSLLNRRSHKGMVALSLAMCHGSQSKEAHLYRVTATTGRPHR